MIEGMIWSRGYLVPIGAPRFMPHCATDLGAKHSHCMGRRRAVHQEHCNAVYFTSLTRDGSTAGTRQPQHPTATHGPLREQTGFEEPGAVYPGQHLPGRAGRGRVRGSALSATAIFVFIPSPLVAFHVARIPFFWRVPVGGLEDSSENPSDQALASPENQRNGLCR